MSKLTEQIKAAMDESVRLTKENKLAEAEAILAVLTTLMTQWVEQELYANIPKT